MFTQSEMEIILACLYKEDRALVKRLLTLNESFPSYNELMDYETDLAALINKINGMTETA